MGIPMDTGTAMKTKPNWLAATTGVLCYCIVTPVIGQDAGSLVTPIATPSGENAPGAAAAPDLSVQGATASNEPSTARAWTIVPRIGVTETLTDNINLTATDKQTGLISELSPGVRIDARTARLRMFLDYQLNGIFYSTGDNGNQTQSALSAFGTVEAIDNWLFVDFSGQISQELINPFGQQSASNVYDTRNTTQAQTYSVSPYIRGQIGRAHV